MKQFIMKQFIFIILAIFLLGACSTYSAFETSESDKNNQETAIVQDSTKYELLILDIGFESWFATRNLRASAHSEWYYTNWNQIYVNEWNRLYLEGHPYFENYIDYSPYEEYGFDINYKLYNYFQFVEEKTGIKLVTR
ncbi:DUF6146 family protein [Ancylomarina longa]|uniref:Lipoprotein n=1 Tax=Ancylomarina longa TaxID=2487017 RepID=A0A434AWK4_9BACT|nr:DUF6146 family protein [Ancylomarina longa]RUT78904.1 hypothetical protein DLK05_05310 [Ancylomarina longa]